MTDTRTALEDTLRRSPDDWPRWLVYADWLAEQGDSRAQIIALEHKLATAALSPQERQDLLQRSHTMQQEEQGRWRHEGHGGLKLRWRHGFVVGVEVPEGVRDLRLLERILAHPEAPLLDTLILQEGEHMRALADQPGLRRLRELHALKLSDQALRALAFSPMLEGLQVLVATHGTFREGGARALGSSHALQKLERLALSHSHLGDEGAVALAVPGGLRSLRWLDLSDNDLGDEGAAALANLGALSRLDLSQNRIGAEGLSALARASQGLVGLRLVNNRVGDEGVRALAESEAPRALQTLELRANGIGDEGARALASSQSLGGLEWLNLSLNEIGPEGVRALASSENLRALRGLDLRTNPLGGEGLAALTSSETLRGCRVLR